MGCFRKAFFLLLLAALPWMAAEEALADLSDPCDSTGGPGEYANLTEPDADYIAWSSPPDGSYLCQSSNRRQASAVYYVPGAVRVEVAIYSRYGSYAARSGEGWSRGGEDRALRYHASSDEVYCGDWRMAYDAEAGEFVFLEEEAPSGLSDYGLSVYASGDGESYDRVPAVLISAETEGGGAYYYEVYEADLEDGTSYLRLTLTDQSSIQIVGREERYQFESTGGLSLASVEVESGEPQEPSEEGSGEFPEPPEGGSSGPEPFPDDGSSSPGYEEPPDPVLPEETERQPEPMEQPGSPEEGPAFEEELPEESSSSQESAPASSQPASGDGAPSSSPGEQGGGTAGGAEKGQGSDDAGGDGEEGMIQGKRLILDAEERGEERSFWERALEPDAVTMLLFAAALIVAALRILWKKE